MANGGRISGGAGVDILNLAAGTTLDLETLTNNQTVKPIQEIEILGLQGNATLTLSANDVLSLGGANASTMLAYAFNSTTGGSGTTSSTGKVQMVVLGNTGDVLNLQGLANDGITGTGVNAGIFGNSNLAGSWSYKGDVVLGGVTYKVYDHSTTQAQVLVKSTVGTVTLSTSPLMLDLNGDGVHTSSLADGVKFDSDGTGQMTFTGWSDGKDGFLVLDLNSDGTINNGTEMFGNSTKLADGQTKAKDGFEALRQYDLNHDNLIDANDAVFANLKIWVDANKDGVSQSEELHGLADIGVHAMKLSAEVAHTLDNGNVLSQVSSWVDNRGQEHAFVDVTFATSWQSQANHAVM